MAKYKVSPLIVLLLIISYCEGFNPIMIGEMFASMKDENTKSMNQMSHLHCFLECMRRKPCVFISSTYLEAIFARERPYKCHLYLSNESETIRVQTTCKQHNLPTRVLPQAIAGACSDHKCSTYDRCLPLSDGGYHCKLERRRGNKKAAKGDK